MPRSPAVKAKTRLTFKRSGFAAILFAIIRPRDAKAAAVNEKTLTLTFTPNACRVFLSPCTRTCSSSASSCCTSGSALVCPAVVASPCRSPSLVQQRSTFSAGQRPARPRRWRRLARRKSAPVARPIATRGPSPGAQFTVRGQPRINAGKGHRLSGLTIRVVSASRHRAETVLSSVSPVRTRVTSNSDLARWPAGHQLPSRPRPHRAPLP